MRQLAMMGVLFGFSACHPYRDHDRECSSDLRNPCVDDTGGDDDPQWVSRTDVGEACLTQEDGQLVAQVVLESCASSCIRELATNCTVTLQGDEIAVIAHATWLPPSTGSCDASCLVVVATCSVEAPPSGVYAFSYGDQLTGADTSDLPVCAVSL